MLVHSRRFFACIQQCDETQNQWHMRIEAPDSDYILVHGKVHKSQTYWIDKNDGTKVYVGKQKPFNFAGLFTVIDPALPAALKSSIESSFPRIMSSFEQRFGPLNAPPMLLFSTSYSTDGKVDRKGGVLPNQVVFHVHAPKQTKRSFDIWFTTHEIAHLFQKEGVQTVRFSESWLHEGAAEYLTTQWLKQASHQQLIHDKMSSARRHCFTTLKGKSLSETQRKDARLFYTCGLLLFHKLETLLKPSGQSVSQIWKIYTQRIRQGETANSDLMIDIIRSYVKTKSKQRWISFFREVQISPQETYDRI
ncbi:hypothetical protein [Algicola sagamiensis]|uniref:hypothetical protein n=1 Tax=Algicola sagamiensis TaxID=163869 RepID=UPI00036C2AF2|nr:hypothetical protein [Algicola sagamiensis]